MLVRGHTSNNSLCRFLINSTLWALLGIALVNGKKNNKTPCYTVNFCDLNREKVYNLLQMHIKPNRDCI